MTDTQDEHFYISSELSEVVDLILKRQQLLNDIGLALHTNNPYNKLYTNYLRNTARLETLIKKTED